MKIAIRFISNEYLIFDIKHRKLEAKAGKLRELNKGLKFSKKDVLISCLNYNFYMG